jgi:hypothetical protein
MHFGLWLARRIAKHCNHKQSPRRPLLSPGTLPIWSLSTLSLIVCLTNRFWLARGTYGISIDSQFLLGYTASEQLVTRRLQTGCVQADVSQSALPLNQADS